MRILGKNTIFNEHPVFAKEIIFQKAINCGKAFCTSAKKQSVPISSSMQENARKSSQLIFDVSSLCTAR